MSAPHTGETIGNVRLEEVIEEGNVDILFRGYHTTLSINVMVQMLRPERLSRQADFYYEYFRRAAHMAARFDDHPHIVRVLDFGQYNALPYIVLDWSDGFSLRAYLNSHPGPLNEKTVLHLLWSLVNAIESLHNADLVHCDLKPTNLLISRRGRLKITSLGLTHTALMSPGDVDADQSLSPKIIFLTETPASQDTYGFIPLTLDHIVGGTPAYMTPESFLPTGTMSAQSDIYTLGVIGYEMIFGRLPYEGDVVQIINGHLRGEARFDLSCRCSAGTIDIVKQMMCRDPAARPQQVKTIAHTLQLLMEDNERQLSAQKAAECETTTTSSDGHSMLSDVAQSMERRLDSLTVPPHSTTSKIFSTTRRMMEKVFDPLSLRHDKKSSRP